MKETSIRVYTDTSDPQLVTTTSRTVFRASFLEKWLVNFYQLTSHFFDSLQWASGVSHPALPSGIQ